jgi:hypothetical protein
MKTTNISILAILTATIAVFQGCSDDFLELEPKTNRLEANSYNTQEDAFNAVVAVYDALAVQPWNFVPLQSDIFSDDAFCGGEQGGGMWQWQDQEIGIIDAENAAANDLWNRCYSGNYRANMFLQKEAGFAWQSENLRKRYHAEVITLRAYFYFDLVRHYGWVPIIDALLPSSEDYKDAQQNTPKEIFDFIAGELMTAMPDLPETVPSSEKGRITTDMVRVLLARVYMFYESFGRNVLGVEGDLQAKGMPVTKQYVLDGLETIIASNRYKLLDNYADVFAWDNENNGESVFEWQYSEKTSHGDWGNMWGTDGALSIVMLGPRNPNPDTEFSAGWSFGVITWSLFNEFEAADTVRLKTTIFDAGEQLTGYTPGFQNTGMFNLKYMPRADYYSTSGASELNWRKNYIDMRYADVLLMAAELILEQDQTKATGYLNEVRTRAMGDAAALSSITIDDIYHERRVEFAGEGHRKWDLLRRGLDYAKQKIDASWDIPSGLVNSDEFSGREFRTDTWGMLPVPAAEIRLSNNNALKQYVPAFQ